ncbi:MAG: hypothetical protein VZR27_11620 [Acutalibacteraceae bacterium]|nr:hypothetical protein [Acutalibacteraceae bacterium]
MFLMLLKEENKERFLKVCVYAAMSNEIFAEEEKLMISAYCREMNIAEHIPETTAEFDAFIPEVAENTDSKEKNIILLETLALIRSDGIYDDREQAFMNSLTLGLGLPLSKLDDYLVILDKYNEMAKEMLQAIEA